MTEGRITGRENSRRAAIIAIIAMVGVVGLSVSAASGQATESSAGRQGTPKIVRKTASPGMAPGMAPALGGFANASAPGPLTKERLDRYAQVLELDADQTKAAQALHETYVAQVQKGQKSMREEMRRLSEDLQDGDMSALQQKIGPIAQKMRETSTSQRDQFLSDLKSLLRPEQAGNWDRLDRLRRRDNVLPRGALSGSTIDLVNIIDAMKLADPMRVKLTSPLEEYSVDLDRPLREREAAVEKDAAEPVKTFDAETYKKHQEAGLAIDAKVADVNQRHTRLLAGLLPDDMRKAFEDQVRQQSFKQAYRPTKAARQAEAAAKLQGLSAEKRKALEQALAKYRERSRPLNDNLASALERAEKAGRPANLNAFSFGPGAEKQDPDITAARQARREADNQLKEELAKLLTQEQLASLNTSSGGGGARVVSVTSSDNGEGVHTTTNEIEIDPEELEGLGGGGDGTPRVLIINDHKEVPAGEPGTSGTPPKPGTATKP